MHYYIIAEFFCVVDTDIFFTNHRVVVEPKREQRYKNIAHHALKSCGCETTIGIL